jgi:hypothetical protein
MSCAWVSADTRDLTRLGLRTRQSAGARRFAIFDDVSGFGAPTVLLHRHGHGFMLLHDWAPLGILVDRPYNSADAVWFQEIFCRYPLRGSMDVSAEPGAPREITYAYKPTLIGAPFEFRLAPAGLEWRKGGRGDCIPYERIRRLRLSFRPVNMQSYRFLAEIWAPGAPKLQVSSTSWRSMMEQERHDAEYAAFIAELHRRMAAAGSTASFEAGSPPVIYWLGAAVFAAICLALAALIVRALQAGAFTAAALVGGFLALSLWQVGMFFRRNRPATYRPDALPDQVMPQARE